MTGYFGRIATAALLLGSSVGAGEASAGSTLGIAGNYGEFVFGDSTRQNSASRGPVAVGGNASFANYSVASSPLSTSTIFPVSNTLVVGGNLGWTNGQLASGTGVVAGSKSLTGVGGGSIAVAASPINFGAVKSDLLSLSASLYDSSQSFTSPVYSTLTLGNASSSGIQVFNVSGADLSAASSFVLRGSADSTVIVNVVGNVSNWSGGLSRVGGLTSSHILWNFVDATGLSLNGIGVDGTVLAVRASVLFNNGQLNGSLIAGSLAGGGATYIDQGGNGQDARFTGSIPNGAVPEPASIAMLGTAAILGLGFAARRGRVLR